MVLVGSKWGVLGPPTRRGVHHLAAASLSLLGWARGRVLGGWAKFSGRWLDWSNAEPGFDS